MTAAIIRQTKATLVPLSPGPHVPRGPFRALLPGLPLWAPLGVHTLVHPLGACYGLFLCLLESPLVTFPIRSPPQRSPGREATMKLISCLAHNSCFKTNLFGSWGGQRIFWGLGFGLD